MCIDKLIKELFKKKISFKIKINEGVKTLFVDNQPIVKEFVK